MEPEIWISTRSIRRIYFMIITSALLGVRISIGRGMVGAYSAGAAAGNPHPLPGMPHEPRDVHQSRLEDFGIRPKGRLCIDGLAEQVVLILGTSLMIVVFKVRLVSCIC